MSAKFDVVIGNPPYQKDTIGDQISFMPVYNEFMDAAYEVGKKAVLITPARFLFDAGLTPKAWNQKMLDDPHLSVPIYVQKSGDLFPGTNIMGGIAVTYRDPSHQLGPVRVFVSFPELRSVMNKVESFEEGSFRELVGKRGAYRYTDLMHFENPQAIEKMPGDARYVVSSNAFEVFPSLFLDEVPTDSKEYVSMLGLEGRERKIKWVRRDYIADPGCLDRYKVSIPASRGHLGSLGDEPALVVGHPEFLNPGVGATMTFLTIGAFESKGEAEACLKYVKSKFSRALLGVLKATPNNPREKWKYVPLQDFTENSDIDWSKSIPEIDQQLYAKYGLDDEEIEFIESHVKPMD